MEFDEIQQFVLQNYAGGVSLHVGPEGIQGCGDNLLAFLLAELSNREGCKNLDDARQRLDTVIRQLTDLQDSIPS